MISFAYVKPESKAILYEVTLFELSLSRTGQLRYSRNDGRIVRSSPKVCYPTAEEIERTKESLKDALFALMKEKEYPSITMSEVAQKAGNGRATLYRHFQSKQDIINFYFEKYNAIFQDLKSITIRSKDDFYEVIFRVFSTLKDNKEIVKLLISAHPEFMYLDFMNTALVRNFEQNGYIVSRYSPYYFMGSLFNVTMQWVQNDCEESVRQITDFYYDHLFNVKLMP